MGVIHALWPTELNARVDAANQVTTDHGCGGFAVTWVLTGAGAFVGGASSNFGAAGATRCGGRTGSAGADAGAALVGALGLAISSKPLSKPCMPFLNSTT